MRVIREICILQTLPNVKVASYDKNIVNVDLSILEIL